MHLKLRAKSQSDYYFGTEGVLNISLGAKFSKSNHDGTEGLLQIPTWGENWSS